jgi:hypothetical protein
LRIYLSWIDGDAWCAEISSRQYRGVSPNQYNEKTVLSKSCTYPRFSTGSGLLEGDGMRPLQAVRACVFRVTERQPGEDQMAHGETSAKPLAFKELGPASIRGSQSFSVVSQCVDQTFIIDVLPPPASKVSGRPIPVVFVLDGDALFGIVAQTALYLQLDPGGLPPVLVVGVGYRTEGDGSAGSGFGKRTRDLTPSVDGRYVAMLRAAPAPFTLPPDIEPGGAANFLSFIKEELVPFLASRYPIDVNDQTIIGMSLGGLFALRPLQRAVLIPPLHRRQSRPVVG